MFRLFFILPIIFAFFVSCKKAGLAPFVHQENSSTASSAESVKASDRPSDSSGGVPGYLTLGCTLSFPADGLGVDSACVLADQAGKASLPTYASVWSWKYELEDQGSPAPTVIISELTQDQPFHVVYRFTGQSREKLLSQAQKAKFSLKMQPKDGSDVVVIQESIAKKLNMSLATRFRYIKITFPSLKAPWPDTQELDIERLELKWENVWRQGVFSDFSGRIGPYEAIVSASSYAVDRNSFPFYAFQRAPAGNIWETAFRTYDTGGQHDAIGAPQWLKIDFKDYPIALQGIKIDGGDSRDTAGSEGSPDSFYIEGSADDVSWTLIEGSRFENVDTTNLASFEWGKP